MIRELFREWPRYRGNAAYDALRSAVISLPRGNRRCNRRRACPALLDLLGSISVTVYNASLARAGLVQMTRVSWAAFDGGWLSE